MAEGGKAENEPTLVERWFQDQQQWQRTLLAYFDSMMKNDEFLVHLGNAMRGSLLAGKPYPSAAPPGSPQDSPHDDRLDKVLFALNQLQGQLQDLTMTLEDIRDRLDSRAGSSEPRPGSAEPAAPAARRRRVRG